MNLSYAASESHIGASALRSAHRGGSPRKEERPRRPAESLLEDLPPTRELFRRERVDRRPSRAADADGRLPQLVHRLVLDGDLKRRRLDIPQPALLEELT